MHLAGCRELFESLCCHTHSIELHYIRLDEEELVIVHEACLASIKLITLVSSRILLSKFDLLLVRHVDHLSFPLSIPHVGDILP